MKRIFLATILLLSAAARALPSEKECLRAHPDLTSPVEMATCTFDLPGSEQAFQDALKTTAATPALKEVQTRWLAYRDAECAYQSDERTGTMASSDTIACKATMNRARAAQLHSNAAK